MNDKDNKLIAEFMGVPQGKHTHFMVEPFALESYAEEDDLKYDSSWDWLMPVVQKIEKLEVGDVKWTSVYFNIEREYDKAVKFIKTYNDER